MSQNDQVIRLPIPTEGPLEPPAEWEQLRGQCPVATVELPSGDTGKLLTRYDDVRNLLTDPRFARPTTEDNSARVAPEGAGGSAATGDYELAIPDNGEPHLRWRRQVGKYFTAKRMRALRTGMTETAENLIDAMVEHGKPADLKAALGFPLPVYVICDLLGAPADDRERFSYWSDAFLNVTRFSKDETRTAHTEFIQYMSDLIAAKRTEPGEDLLSMLIKESEAEGEGMTDAELLSTGMGLLVMRPRDHRQHDRQDDRHAPHRPLPLGTPTRRPHPHPHRGRRSTPLRRQPRHLRHPPLPHRRHQHQRRTTPKRHHSLLRPVLRQPRREHLHQPRRHGPHPHPQPHLTFDVSPTPA